MHYLIASLNFDVPINNQHNFHRKWQRNKRRGEKTHQKEQQLTQQPTHIEWFILKKLGKYMDDIICYVCPIQNI